MNQLVSDPNQLSLTESQIAALVVDENVGSIQLNFDILRQFELTNRLACKILCALCEVNQQNSNPSAATSATPTTTNSTSSTSQTAANSGGPLTSANDGLSPSTTANNSNGQANNNASGGSLVIGNDQRPLELAKGVVNNPDLTYITGRINQDSPGCIKEIDLFAEFCRQNSINLQQLLQTFDDQDFISDRIFRNTNYVLQPQKHSSVPPLAAFQRFWQFCTNLASTDKNGLYSIGRAFFSQIWQHNQGFQLNFITNCIEQNLISKIFSQSQQANALQQQPQLNLNQIVPYSELLKCQPDFEAIPELNNWKFQRLYQILIDFTVPGNIPNLQMNSNCFARVLELFAWPLQYCPDLTVLGLLGVTGQSSAAKVEILSSAIPTFLNASHPNAAIILHSIWSIDSHSSADPSSALNQQKPTTPLTWSQKTLLQALSDHYTKSPPEEQQQRLSRILDVAQDIKTLFRLLDGTCYPFVIDLACLASRREYLKLDKWLMDKFTENGENFIRALNSFLTKRYMSLLTGANKDLAIGPTNMCGPPLPAETLAVMLTFLQQCVMPPSGSIGTPFNDLSQTVKKEVYALVGNSSLLLQRAPRHPPPGVVTSMPNDYSRNERLVGFPMDRPALISEVDKLQAEFEAKRLAQRTQRATTNQPMHAPVTRPSIANNANIDNLLAAGSSENYPVPPEVIQDKVFFIVNNLSLINLKQKAEEFKELFGNDDTYFGWTAQYFSTKRAALEQNFQPLYANFLYELKNPKLIEAMTRETYRNIKHLLRLDKKADNINERSVLKNLGQWLGLLTLARNKPILHVDLDLKGLLVEAYHKGTQELLYVVPFLAEILKTTQKSKIFKPNNPFVLGLLRALVELRQQPNLKLNLEFQVEVLFNYLGVDLNKLVGQSNILNDDKYYSRLEFQLGTKQISGQQQAQPHMQQAIKAQLQQQNAGQQQISHNINNIVMRPNEFGTSLSPPRHPPPGVVTSMPNDYSRNERLVGFPMDRPALISEVDKLQAEFEAKRLAQRTQRATTNQPMHAPVTRPSIANNANIDNLLAAGSSENYPVPPEVIQDKVFFIVNNLSLINLKQKAEEFKELFGNDDTYFGWTAQYFSTKRAALEQNFQPLYANFLYELKNPKLIEAMTRETYRNIKHLLRLDKKADNINERSVLKNLGQWLGLLTLARNKPILHVDLDLKGLLVEAYHKGTQELLYVVPFLAEILKTTQKSKIFKPNNPFVLGLLRALVELRQQPNLKLNLEFQVEVLFNYLGVDLNKLVGQSNILNDDKYYSRLEFQLGTKQISGQQQAQPHMQQAIKAQLQQQNAGQQQISHNINNIVMRPNEFGTSLSPLNTPPLMSLGNSGSLPGQVGSGLQATMSTSPVNWSSKFKYSDLDVTNTASLNNLINIQPTLALLNLQPALKATIRPAIELAISEWLPVILEKCLKTCLPTVEQVIKKDFALDPDENHMQRAAHCLTRHLVSHMAMMACRDPEQVEQSLTSCLRSAFTRAYPSIRKEQIEHASLTITADNLELARAFIIKASIERALADIDKLLQTEYELRRNARLDGHQYFNQEYYAFHTKLANDGLRLKPAPTGPEQLRNYEEVGQNMAGFKRSDLPYSEATLGTTSPFNELGQINMAPIVTPTSTNPGKASPLGPPSLGSNMVNQLISGRVITPNQFANQQLSGFVNIGDGSKATTPHSAMTEADSNINFFDSLVNEIMPQLRQLAQSLPANLTPEIAQIVHSMQVLRANPLDRNYKMLIVKILDSMYELVFENTTTLDYTIICRCKELHILLLRALAETFGSGVTTRQITRHAWARHLQNIQESKKSAAPEIFLEVLMQNQLTNDAFFDDQLVLLTETSLNPTLLIRFIHRFSTHFNENSLPKTVDLLSKLKSMASQPFAIELQSCIDALQTSSRNPAGYLIQPAVGSNSSFTNTSPQIQPMNTSNTLLQRETAEGDPPGLVDKTERLLREWVSIHQSGQIVKMFPVFVQQMTAHGILKTDDLVTRFFRLSTEMCVESCYRLLATQPNGPNSLELRNKCYETLDAFTMLIVLLIKNSGSSSSSNLTPEPAAKINLLSKILSIIANVAIKDQESRQSDFQHLAYYRILILLFIELNLSPPMLGLPANNFNNFNQMSANVDIIAENVQFQVLNEFTKTLRTLRPSRVPSFAFAWLDFLSHRLFVEKCLFGYPANRPPGSVYKGWALYAQLLIDLIRFEAPFLRNVELPQSVDLLYKGTLKMFLVLLHDFPEFLCEYCYSLCDVIPCNAIQLRNLVLSAFPRKMRLPDPFTPNLKIEQLQEMSQPPKTGALQTNLINSVAFKEELDTYLRTRTPVTFLNNLTNYLRCQNQYLVSLSGSSTMNSLNVPLLNALVLYVGQSAISAISPRPISMTSIAGTTHMDVIQHLATTMDTEGRYLFLNAIANQLRYPNSHTHYFSSALLYLFAVATSEKIQEQITRVLVERLIIMRPHPWGLLVTFIELIKNPLFKFWKHEFVRCAPEIEKLFESVARSCCVQNTGVSQKGK